MINLLKGKYLIFKIFIGIITLLLPSVFAQSQGEEKGQLKLTPFRCFITEGYCQVEVEFNLRLVDDGEYCIYQEGFDEQIFCFEGKIYKRKLIILTDENIKFFVLNEKQKTKLAVAEFYVMKYKSGDQKKRRRRAWEIF